MPEPGDSSRHLATARTRAPAWLSLEIVEENGDWPAPPAAEELVKAAGEALTRHSRFKHHAPAEAAVALCNSAAVRRLNARYRGIDAATNVLSFPTAAGSAARRARPEYLGDIAIAQEVVLGEAAELGISPADHLQHLVVHGLLHLLGFNHDRDEEAEIMESLEIDILGALGVPDPYRPRAAAAKPGAWRGPMTA
jgi:probable rRNA maturation factor